MNELEAAINALDELAHLLYSCTNCAAGGPLHIVLDDGNMYDQDMSYSRECIAKNEHGFHKCVLTTSLGILDILEDLSPAQRYLWYHERYTTDFMKKLSELHDKTYVENDYGEFIRYEPWKAK